VMDAVELHGEPPKLGYRHYPMKAVNF